MIRDRQHGPVIEINRIQVLNSVTVSSCSMHCDTHYKHHLQVKRSRSKGGLAGAEGIKSVFGQVCQKMSTLTPDSLMLPHRIWKVKFIGRVFVPHSHVILSKIGFRIYCIGMYFWLQGRVWMTVEVATVSL